MMKRITAVVFAVAVAVGMSAAPAQAGPASKSVGQVEVTPDGWEWGGISTNGWEWGGISTNGWEWGGF